MKCLLCYEWVKLPRNNLPVGKGVMGAWAKLASCVAYRKGTAKYCGYENEVTAGMWAGGVVGLKSILGIKNRTKALAVLDELVKLGLVSYTLDEKTKKLELTLSDWVHNCDGGECMSNSVYVTEGYGFLCITRNITERLVEQNYTFEESDAWLDLWCHTVYCDFSNAFSFAAPAVQYGKEGSILTLETLGKRWNWEKTKVWRFMRKHRDTFVLRRLTGSFGCVVFNAHYPDDQEYYTTYKTINTLKTGKVLSCGCLYKQTRSDTVKYRKDLVAGTSISNIVVSKRLRSNNTSGHTGVGLDKKTGKWYAFINFQGKHYFLGSYKEKVKAIDARRRAEERLHDPIILEYWESLTNNRKIEFANYLCGKNSGH